MSGKFVLQSIPCLRCLCVVQELYAQFKANEEVYSQLLAKGRLMLLSRDDSGSGSKTEQSVALLEQKWGLVSMKMEERKVMC